MRVGALSESAEDQLLVQLDELWWDMTAADREVANARGEEWARQLLSSGAGGMHEVLPMQPVATGSLHVRMIHSQSPSTVGVRIGWSDNGGSGSTVSRDTTSDGARSTSQRTGVEARTGSSNTVEPTQHCVAA